MPRPTQQQKIVVRATPAPESQAPQLGVVAPIDGVRAAPAGSGWQGLAQSLGMLTNAAAPVIQANMGARQKADTADGQADAILGQVDPERVKRSTAYADASHEVNVIKQYQAAQDAVMARAATELDAGKPYPDQAAQLDQWMKEELGGLAQDPRAKAIIAPRYQKFIENATNGILKNQVEARANEALDTTKADIASSFTASGTIDIGSAVNRLTPLLGDKVKARDAVVNMVNDLAVDTASKGGDWKAVIGTLQQDITLPDGSKIPGPGRSPASHDAILRATDAAQKAYNAFKEPQHAESQAHLFVQLGEMMDKGQLITEKMLTPYLQPGADGSPPLLTATQLASYVNANRDRRAQLAKEHAVRQYMIGPGWQNALNQRFSLAPTGQLVPDPQGKIIYTKDDAQKGYDQHLSQTSANFADPKDTATKAVALTKAINGGLGSSTLKAQLAGAANRSTPEAALAMLPAYDIIHAEGQDALYLTPAQSVYYENLRFRQQNPTNPHDPEASRKALLQAAAQYDPTQVKHILDTSLPEARKAIGTVSEGSHWYKLWMDGGPNLADFASTSQFAAISDPLLKQSLLDSGGNVDAAVQATRTAILAHYAPVEINGVRALLPKDGTMTNEEIQGSLNSISHVVVPALAKAASANKEQAERATWQPIQLPGQLPVVQVIDGDTGLPIPGADVMLLSDILAMGKSHYAKLRDRINRAEADRVKHPEPNQGTPLYINKPR